MRKNLNVNKIVNEMDYLLYIIMKQEWEEHKDYFLELVNNRGKAYRCIYFELKNNRYGSFTWKRDGVVWYIENYSTPGVNIVKSIRKINNEIMYFKFPENGNYRVIIEMELFKSICEIEKI
jgi:hypothetical protein